MDRLRDEQAWLVTASLSVMALVVMGFGLSYTRGVLIPFVLAVFLASVVSPLVDFQVVRMRFPRALAVIVAMLVVVVVLCGCGLIAINTIQTIVRSAGEYSSNIIEMGNDLLRRLKAWNISVDAQELFDQMKAAAPRITTSVVAGLTGFVSKGVLVLIFVGFLLAGRDSYAVRTGVYADIDTQIRRYLGTKFVISAITGLLVWLCLRMFHLELASVFGLFAFMLNFIPSVGSIIATFLPLPTAAAQFSDDPLKIIGVLAVPGVIQLTIGNVIEPKLMGEGLKLHPVTILMSLAVWGLLWGPIGMLLAVPMTATIRIVLDQFQITTPVSRLLAGTLPGTQDKASRSLT
jgi:AI-2 transport protein TqsA